MRNCGLAASLFFLSTGVGHSAPNPPLCIDSICIEDEVSKIKDLDWMPLKPTEASQTQWDEALAFWQTIFPNAQSSNLEKLRQNLVKHRFDRNFIEFLEKRPTICRFETFKGWIEDEDQLYSVSVAPDTDYQWRVVRISKFYRNIPNSDQVSAYVKAVKTKYTQWEKDDHWGDGEAPVNWEKNPISHEYDFHFSLRHLVIYGSTPEHAESGWARSFDHFIKHREQLSGKGATPMEVFDSDKYDNLYKYSEPCTPEVNL
jgi:hypothetical protein